MILSEWESSYLNCRHVLLCLRSISRHIWDILFSAWASKKRKSKQKSY